jgi:hypothetical protein
MGVEVKGGGNKRQVERKHEVIGEKGRGKWSKKER